MVVVDNKLEEMVVVVEDSILEVVVVVVVDIVLEVAVDIVLEVVVVLLVLQQMALPLGKGLSMYCCPGSCRIRKLRRFQNCLRSSYSRTMMVNTCTGHCTHNRLQGIGLNGNIPRLFCTHHLGVHRPSGH